MTTTIDGHVHIWPRDKTNYPPALVPGRPLADVDGDAGLLIDLMNANGIARTIVVQAPWYAHADNYVEDMMVKYPGRYTGIRCLPFGLTAIDPEFEAARLGQGRMRGCRVQVLDKADGELVSKGGLDGFFRRAAEIGEPILIWHRNHHMHGFVGAMAARHPDLPLVIEHMAYATARLEKGPDYVDALMALSRYPNVHVKLAVHHQLSSEAFPWKDLHGLQNRFIAEFGAERLLWGSNFPMFMPEPSYEQRLSVLRDHFAFRTQSDRDWILGGTAAKLWPL